MALELSVDLLLHAWCENTVWENWGISQADQQGPRCGGSSFRLCKPPYNKAGTAGILQGPYRPLVFHVCMCAPCVEQRVNSVVAASGAAAPAIRGRHGPLAWTEYK